MREFVRIELTHEERERLEVIARSRTLAARLVQRAKMVLLTAEGRSQKEIAEMMGCNVKTVGEWQRRWLEAGFAGIETERPGRGRKPWVIPAVSQELLRKTLEEAPVEATRWSTRRMAKALGIGATTVRKVWKQHGLKPHRIEIFKPSNELQFEEKLADVVGLYLNPAVPAVILPVDDNGVCRSEHADGADHRGGHATTAPPPGAMEVPEADQPRNPKTPRSTHHLRQMQDL